jgi:hypothetical protein
MPYLEFESEWIDPHVFEFTYKSEYQVPALTKEETFTDWLSGLQ